MNKASFLIQLGLEPVPKRLYAKRSQAPALAPAPEPETKPKLKYTPEPVPLPKLAKIPASFLEESDYVAPPEMKICEACGGEFFRRKRRSIKQWKLARYCSYSCARAKNPFNRVGATTYAPSVLLTLEERKRLQQDIVALLDSGIESVVGMYHELIRLGKLPCKEGRYMTDYALYRLVRRVRQYLNKPRKENKAAMILKMVDLGMSDTDIALELKCGISYIQCVLRRWKIAELKKQEIKA